MAAILPPDPSGVRLGVDLGGTKIEIIALEADSNRELWRRRVATPQGDYSATLHAIAALVAEAEQQAGKTGTVGVGIPGALSPASGLVKNANSTCLIGRPLDQDLQQLLCRPVRLANDADCFALSEATDGAGQGSPVVFGAILGTGVGAGIVVHGRLLHGPNAIAGEWGHTPLPWPQDDERPGPACYCGKQGCIECFLSGPGLGRLAGLDLDPARLVTAAESGNAAAEQALRHYEDRLARALAMVINILDPDVIILGGGMGRMGRLYRNVPRLWGRHVFSDHVATRLLPPKHGDSSGVRGAAWLWNEPEEGSWRGAGKRF